MRQQKAREGKEGGRAPCHKEVGILEEEWEGVAFAPGSPAWATGTARKAAPHASDSQGKEAGKACKGGLPPEAAHRTWRKGACNALPEALKTETAMVPQLEPAKLRVLEPPLLPVVVVEEYWQVVVVVVEVLLLLEVVLASGMDMVLPPSTLLWDPWISMVTSLVIAVAVGFVAALSLSSVPLSPPAAPSSLVAAVASARNVSHNQSFGDTIPTLLTLSMVRLGKQRGSQCNES